VLAPDVPDGVFAYRYRGALVALSTALIGACTALPAPALSTAPASAPPRSVPTVPELPWDLAADLASMHSVAKTRSNHEAGSVDAEIFANAAAVPYPKLGPSRQASPGATLVEQLSTPGEDRVLAVFAMRKRDAPYAPRGGDWEFAIARPNGDVLERGRLPRCARCHAEGPYDGLYGPARP